MSDTIVRSVEMPEGKYLNAEDLLKHLCEQRDRAKRGEMTSTRDQVLEGFIADVAAAIVRD